MKNGSKDALLIGKDTQTSSSCVICIFLMLLKNGKYYVENNYLFNEAALLLKILILFDLQNFETLFKIFIFENTLVTLTSEFLCVK